MVLFQRADGQGRAGPLRNLADIFSSNGKKACNNRASASQCDTSCGPQEFPLSLQPGLHMFLLRNSFGAVKDKRFNMEGKKT